MSEQGKVGIFGRLKRRMHQFLCGLRGHAALLHFEDGRMSLQCSSCNHETPGWDVRPSAVANVAPAPRIITMPLVRERRVA